MKNYLEHEQYEKEVIHTSLLNPYECTIETRGTSFLTRFV